MGDIKGTEKKSDAIEKNLEKVCGKDKFDDRHAGKLVSIHSFDFLDKF